MRVLELSIKFYHLCEDLKLKYHIKEQLLRSSASISLNIAEGCGKMSYKDQRKYFNIAYGSLRESITALRLARIESSEILASRPYRWLLIQINEPTSFVEGESAHKQNQIRNGVQPRIPAPCIGKLLIVTHLLEFYRIPDTR